MAVAAQATEAKAKPILEVRGDTTMIFRGPMGRRLDAAVENWLVPTPIANPGMLAMFHDRDRRPHRDLLPWSGEFAGKYLIGAVQTLRITQDEQLRARLKEFVADLLATQASNGYLGPFPEEYRMIGTGLADLWGQYHIMLGLYLWDKVMDDKQALAACRKCADYFCRFFNDEGRRVLLAGSEEMNQSAIHIFALLHRDTGERKYLDMAYAIEQDWEDESSGDYVRKAMEGIPFHQFPQTRWESLHGLQALGEMHYTTGDATYRDAFERIWWSLLEGERRNNGGFGSNGSATGNPYDAEAIETCATIAWMALTIDYLRMSGDPHAADELEISTWNALLGSQGPSGYWWSHNTPMDGERHAATHDLNSQARPGTPGLNCCSANAARGLGMLADWAVMDGPDGITVNYYGPSSFNVRLPSGRRAQIMQETRYPADGRVRIMILPEAKETFTLRLRIPSWSKDTRLLIADKDTYTGEPGTYLVLDREWRPGDDIVLSLDPSPWAWVGDQDCAGKLSLYRGPLLMAYDPRFDVVDPKDLVPLRIRGATPKPANPKPHTGPRPLVLQWYETMRDWEIALCDFASAGATGGTYRTWFPAGDMKPAPFSKENPLRIVR